MAEDQTAGADQKGAGSGVSRRNVMLGAAATAAGLAAEGISSTAAAATCPQGNPVYTEGFFFVIDDAGGKDDDRIFFIPSEYLEYFEVTGYYRSVGANDSQWKPENIAQKIRKTAGKKNRYKFSAFYADQQGCPVPGAAAFVQLSIPSQAQTYLAQMIGPSVL